MIVDSSALVAIALDEEMAEELLFKLSTSELPAIGAPTLTEVALVLQTRLGKTSDKLVERLVRTFKIQVIPFTEAHALEAAAAHRRFGRGRHPARLNFGDCMSYAVAKIAGEPLLCVGDDFPQTDLELA